MGVVAVDESLPGRHQPRLRIGRVRNVPGKSVPLGWLGGGRLLRGSGGLHDAPQQELVRAKTFKTTLGLMLLDIDHF